MELQTPIQSPVQSPLPPNPPPPTLSRSTRIQLWIIIAVLAVVGLITTIMIIYTRNQPTSPQTTNLNTETAPTSELTPQAPSDQPNPTLMAAYPAKYQTKLDSTQDPPLVKIYPQTDPDTLVWSLPVKNLYTQHYHYAEFHHGYLYAVRRLNYDGYPDNDWTDELWRHTPDGSAVLLWSAKGLDFRASDTNEYLAIEYSDAADSPVIEVINFQGTSLRRFFLEELSSQSDNKLRPSLINWTSDNQLRGEIAFTAFPKELFVINPADFSITHFPYPENGFSFQLNPENLWVAYTNQPIFFDSDTFDEYISTAPEITLNVYNVESQITVNVAQSHAQPFTYYRWLDDLTLEYHTDTATTSAQYRIPQ